MPELLRVAGDAATIAGLGAQPQPDEAGPKPGRHGPMEAESPPSPLPGLEVRGQRALRRLEHGFDWLDRVLQRFLPPALNPLAQLGAVANFCFLVALASGIALLLWYSPSVHQAYSSLEAVRQSSWLGQLIRSLHRYSSDGCVLLILLHALRVLVARRFTGPRWLGWVSGVALLALVWFIGWTGYWLVWDVRAQHVALGTAKFLDCLPIAAEPLARSFLTDQSVHSLLFFLVFFVHMLAPLGVGIALWVHLMRVSRARLFPNRAMMLWAGCSLVALAALLPATSAGPAQMTVKVARFTVDWWFLWPVGLTDRLGGGALWTLFLLAGVAAATLPWTLVKQQLAAGQKAAVDLTRCFGCTLCSKDCPFNAITMVPREDGRNFPVQSFVQPALCVGCGVCVGACDSQAINLPGLDSRKLVARLEAWIAGEVAEGKRPFLALVCDEAAGQERRPLDGGVPLKLPGYHVCAVPCVGWLSAGLLEKVLQSGAGGVLIVGCGSADPPCREGAKWLQQRLAGQREPKLALSEAASAAVRFVSLDRSRPDELIQEALRFREGGLPTKAASPECGLVWQWAAGLVLAAGLGAVAWALSGLPYHPPFSPEPELVISFVHRGEAAAQRPPSKEELAARLPHMRAQVNLSRARVPVRLRVRIDGQTVLERAYKPKGLSSDGPSVALERRPVAPGAHDVQVELADTAEPDKWTRQWRESLEFKPHQTRVLLFETKAGFSLN